MKFTFHDKTVTREFRLALGKEFPGLDSPSRWRMMSYLLFGTCRNDDKELMLAREIVASIEGKKINGHYAAGVFINDFSQNVMPLDVESWRFWAGEDGRTRVRTLKGLRLPAHIESLVQQQRRSRGGDRVWMSSGTKFLRKHSSQARRDHLEEAKSRADGMYLTAEAKLLLDYMNSLPSNRFTSATRHIPEAITVAEALPDAENQLNLLQAIGDRPQPFYAPSDHTTRIFAVGASMNGLHHDVRAVLCQDLIEADLNSAQLAIVAKTWGITKLDEYLASGRKIWPELCDQIGVPFTSANKRIVKEALYSAIYGAGERRMTDGMAHALKGSSLTGEKAFERFEAHLIIQTLLHARTIQLAQIVNAQGGQDAFGQWLPLVYRDVEGYDYKFDNSRSILASISQSYELLLLVPILQEAVAQQFQTHGFSICQWIHDGITFDVHHPDDLEDWERRLSLMVKERADSLGINTRLEFTHYGE